MIQKLLGWLFDGGGAESQGYKPPADRERRPGRQVGGVAQPVDIVVLAG